MLHGYEIYIVEQWACSRDYLISLITTFTGLSQHKCIVSVVSVPAAEEDWTERLRAFVQHVSQLHARKHETPLGTLMVTNLSSFPSTLTVIAIPGGDFRAYEDVFLLNENLKRMGCSGRAGLSLTHPTGATQAKFRQLYCTSDRVLVEDAVIELVRLCQLALFLFRQLAREFTDGLLCDVTITAVKRWWAEIGTEYFNVEPNDGVLGPVTVSALLGLLLGARNRLRYCNAPVNKDVFDLQATKRGIEHFQKWNKIERTRRLDRHTLHRLHRNTSKAVNSERWAVPRAVKSTVTELGGKGGEMVMGMVGARDKKSIAEVETLEISTFAKVISGEHCKWLWQGKPRKNKPKGSSNFSTSEEEPVFRDNKVTATSKRHWKRDSQGDRAHLSSAVAQKDPPLSSFTSSQLSLIQSDKDQLLRKNVLKNATVRVNNARSGAERFEDVVGIPHIGGHSSQLSRDQDTGFGSDSFSGSVMEEIRSTSSERDELSGNDHEDVDALASSNDEFAVNDNTFETVTEALGPKSRATFDKAQSITRDKPKSALCVSIPSHLTQLLLSDHIDKSVVVPTDGTNPIGDHEVVSKAILESHSSLLLRSRSMVVSTIEPARQNPQACRQYRSLSVPRLVGSSGLMSSQASHGKDAIGELGNSGFSYSEAQYRRIAATQLTDKLVSAESSLYSIFQQNFKDLRNTDQHILAEHVRANGGYIDSVVDHSALKQAMVDQVLDGKASARDILFKLEGLMAKLDYEINGLDSKVEDVEDGVSQYEDQVFSLEERARNQDAEELEGKSMIWRMFKFFTGIK